MAQRRYRWYVPPFDLTTPGIRQNAMIDVLSTYAVFVLLGLSLGAYGWLAVAYGMAFRHSRRFSHMQQTFKWIGGGAVSLLVFSILRESGGLRGCVACLGQG
jgi:hypothetical protein